MRSQESGTCCESRRLARKGLVHRTRCDEQSGAAHISRFATVLRRFCQAKDARASERLFTSRLAISNVLNPMILVYLSSTQPTGVRIAWCCGGSESEVATAVIRSSASANAFR
jgi:hypothetical protein